MRWGDYIYWAFDPRVRAFTDKACRLWSPSATPTGDAMPVVPARDRVPPQALGNPRYPGAVVSQADEGLDARACGRTLIDSDVTLAGLAAMGMFQIGVPLSALREFTAEVERSRGWDEVRGTCGRWVLLSHDVPKARDLPDAVREATARRMPILERIVSEAYEIGVSDIQVEADHVLGKVKVAFRKPDGGRPQGSFRPDTGGREGPVRRVLGQPGTRRVEEGRGDPMGQHPDGRQA